MLGVTVELVGVVAIVITGICIVLWAASGEGEDTE